DLGRRLAAEILKAGERAAVLTKQLLAYGRKQLLRPVVLDVNAVVAGMEKMLRRLVGEDIVVETHLAPVLGKTRADADPLEQMILPLAGNARDAMPRGGRLILTTRNVQIDAAFTAANPEVVPGAYVLLAVGDTGACMDEATRARIFEPFLMASHLGKGTGLGLAMVHDIVKQLNGFIEVESGPDKGTTFNA